MLFELFGLFELLELFVLCLFELCLFELCSFELWVCLSCGYLSSGCLSCLSCVCLSCLVVWVVWFFVWVVVGRVVFV